ncbi:MAG: PH domain-containing protein [Actinomycetota bacterium]|nr:PH domain-containing protein [Actinomycetota bacterium]
MTRVIRRTRPSGIDRYLIPDERAEIETRRHWMILTRPVLWSLAVIAVAMFLLSGDPYSEVMRNIVALALLGVAAYLGYQILQWRLDQFVVTNRRVLLVSGVLTRKTAVMPLLKVTDLTYEQTPLARILGYGTFLFESAGQEQALSRVNYLPGGPRQLYKQISELLFNYTGIAAPPPPPRHHTVEVATGTLPGENAMRTHTTTPIPRLGPEWAGDD